MEASGALLGWLDAIPATLQHRESTVASMIRIIRDVDTKLHRAVRQARRWVEEDLTFFRSVHDVLEELEGTLGNHPAHAASAGALGQILSRLRAKEDHDSAEALSLSADFDRVTADLDALRAQVGKIQEQAHDIRDQSLRDSLTGVWNRHAFDGRLSEEVSRAERYGSPLSLALWDVDHFGEFNGQHGHSVGDLVLQTLAARVRGVLRRSDFLARCGGEEFAVILPGTLPPKGWAVAEKIRACAEAARSPGRAGSISVTVSVGTASNLPGDTAALLFDRADRALRRAKVLGRNRVVDCGHVPI